jgi:hypothetical protein
MQGRRLTTCLWETRGSQPGCLFFCLLRSPAGHGPWGDGRKPCAAPPPLLIGCGAFSADVRDTPACRAIGDNFTAKAFEFAHEADPGAELYYNDYNIELPAKRAKALRLLRSLRDAGLRVDAIGIQGQELHGRRWNGVMGAAGMAG